MKFDYYYCKTSEPWDKENSYTVHAAHKGEDRFLCGGIPFDTVKNISFTPYKVCEKCKLLKDNQLVFKVVHAGQLRSYGDTRYEFVFTFTGEGEQPTNDIVYAIAQKIHSARDGENKHPLVDSVLRFEKTGTSQWTYVTGHDYTD